MDNYLELPLYAEDLAEGETFDLWIMRDSQKVFAAFKGVESCIRYKNWWSIAHTFAGNAKMTALVPVNDDYYFNIIIRREGQSGI